MSATWARSRFAGKDALAAVQRIACSDPAQLKVGQAQYAGLLTPEGTFLDDMIVYRMAPSHFLLVVNAGNIAKDYAWISEQAKNAGNAAAIDSSSRYALIAIQGPASREVLQTLTGVELAEIQPFWFSHGEVANARATIARTGYTGEDGYENLHSAQHGRQGLAGDPRVRPFGRRGARRPRRP